MEQYTVTGMICAACSGGDESVQLLRGDKRPTAEFLQDARWK